MTTTENFYRDIQAADNFSAVSDISHYLPLPDDWSIVVTDVENSLVAINNGEYKAVNISGVAVITAISNTLKPLTIPYIFGGDGATLCVPNSVIPAVEKALLSLKALVLLEFKLDLRVGIIPIQLIRDKGHDVLVSKQKVSEHYVQAAFEGQGVQYAETLIKTNVEYQVTESPCDHNADMSGLECRWDKIPGKHGEIVSLIVTAGSAHMNDRLGVYDKVINKISEIYGDNHNARPVYLEGLKITLKNKDLKYESQLHHPGASWISKMRYYFQLRIYNIAGAILMKNKTVRNGVHWGNYKNDLVSNTDYRKFDGVLRLVLSSTTRQRIELIRFLEHKKQNQECCFGFHVSDSAIVTCMLNNRDGEHFHFVDGADGGYAMAATMLKNSNQEAAPASTTVIS